jgi:hypothetical protein
MRVGAEADQRAGRGEQQRDRDHRRDQPGGDVEFDDHHPVERADGQRRRHAHRHLEQGETQQARQRQFGRDSVGEGQEARIQPAPEGGAQARRARLADHAAPASAPRACRDSSSAWEM